MKCNLLVMLTVSFFWLFAQQPEEINDIFSEIINSTPITQDSIDLTLPDSLNVEQAGADSLFPLIKTEPADKPTDLSVEQLFNKLQQNIDREQTIRADLELPFLFAKENFHLASPFEPHLAIRRNGFTEVSATTSQIHTLQNYLPFFETNYNQGFLEFESSNYELPVSVSETFLGLGDIDMNLAGVMFKKGKLFGLENLNFEADYLGQDGLWLGKREKSRNFNLHGWYSHLLGNFHVFYTDIDQEISTNKLSDAPQLSKPELLKEKNTTFAAKWDNRILTAGARYQQTKVDSQQTILKSILLAKTVVFGKHQFSGSYEYFFPEDKTDFQQLTISQFSREKNITFSNRAFYREKEHFYLNSILDWNFIHNLSLLANYEKFGDKNTTSFWQNERKAFGMKMATNMLNLRFLAGKEKIDQDDNLFIESFSNLCLPLNNTLIIAKSWLLYRNTKNLELPVLQSKTELELDYNLPYHNQVKLGLSNYYVSNYGYYQNLTGNLIENDFIGFKAWLGIQLTDRFLIKVDAVNLLNSAELFGYPASFELPARHFNLNVQWLFVN